MELIKALKIVLELAAIEKWRGKPIWVYHGTDVQAAVDEFRKTLED